MTNQIKRRIKECDSMFRKIDIASSVQSIFEERHKMLNHLIEFTNPDQYSHFEIIHYLPIATLALHDYMLRLSVFSLISFDEKLYHDFKSQVRNLRMITNELDKYKNKEDVIPVNMRMYLSYTYTYRSMNEIKKLVVNLGSECDSLNYDEWFSAIAKTKNWRNMFAHESYYIIPEFIERDVLDNFQTCLTSSKKWLNKLNEIYANVLTIPIYTHQHRKSRDARFPDS